jgi:hypothetical protein
MLGGTCAFGFSGLSSLARDAGGTTFHMKRAMPGRGPRICRFTPASEVPGSHAKVPDSGAGGVDRISDAGTARLALPA